MSITMPTLSIEQRIQATAFEVGITVAQLAGYTGVHRTSLAEKIQTGTLGNDLAEKLLETLNVMKQLRYQAKLPIAWDQIVVCRPIVEQALAEFREAKDPVPNEFYIISIGATNYFYRIRNGEVVTVSSIAQATAFADLQQAGTAARELYFRFKTRADFQAIQNHVIKRKLSEMISSFEQVGLSGNPGPKPQ